MNSKLTVFAQGMRRSGTTVFYDLMLQEGSFHCLYEPLAKGNAAYGGGSDIHANIDLFSTLRSERKEFLIAYPEWIKRCPHFLEKNYFNYGAPRLPDLEFEPDLPGYCRDYLGFLVSRSNRSFLKFTRMHSKVHCLKDIEPNAKFVHIVRDPRRVVLSYLFGKKEKNKHRYPDSNTFFTRISNASAWSSRPFSEYILSLNGYDFSGPIEDFKRILLIWKYKFVNTSKEGRACFGDNYTLLKHEDLLANPNAELDRIASFFGIVFNPKIYDWANANIRPAKESYILNDRRWALAFKQLQMNNLLKETGYL